MTYLRRIGAAAVLYSLLAIAEPRLCAADVEATPLSASQVEQAPYKFTGLITHPVSGGTGIGSGAVVRFPKVVLSCAHVVYDGRTNQNLWIDPATGNFRWFWKYHGSTLPQSNSGQLLRGYFKFTGYQTAVINSGQNSSSAFDRDVVAHFAYEDLAGGEFAAGANDGLAALINSSSKMITGYPSGRYSSSHSDKFKMHVTGPFTTALEVSFRTYVGHSGIAAGGGNSGGPTWTRDASGSWFVAGVYISGAEKVTGDLVNAIGVRAMDTEAWTLVASAITTVSGSLVVNLTPVTAINAGAQWQVDGGTFQSSGVTVSGLSIGTHTVSFKSLNGWITPANQLVTITANQTTTTTATYSQQSGALQVNLEPTAAINAGAQWQVDGGTSQSSGGTE
jgi:hypothetical protein